MSYTLNLTQFNFEKCRKCHHLVIYHRKGVCDCGCIRERKRKLTLAMLIKKAEKEARS